MLAEGPAEYLMWRVLDEVAGAAVAGPLLTSLTNEADAMRNGQGNGVAWPQSCGSVDILDDGLFWGLPCVKGADATAPSGSGSAAPSSTTPFTSSTSRHAGKAAGMADMLDVIEESRASTPPRAPRPG